MSENGTRRRAPLIAAGALVGLLLLCGIGGMAYFRPHLSAEYPARLNTPPEVAGMSLSTDADLDQAAAQMAAVMSGEQALRDPIAVVYLSPDDPQRLVALWGGTALLRDPESQLDDAFRAAGEGGFPVSDVHPIDAGPPGGVAKCGQGPSDDDLPMSICGWADHGSLAVGVFFHREVADSAVLLRELRAGIRSR